MNEGRQGFWTLVASWVGVAAAIAGVAITAYQTRQSLALTREQMTREDNDRQRSSLPELALDGVVRHLPAKQIGAYFVLERNEKDVFSLKNVGQGAATHISAIWFVTSIEQHGTGPQEERLLPKPPAQPPFLNVPSQDVQLPTSRTAQSGEKVVYMLGKLGGAIALIKRDAQRGKLWRCFLGF